MRNIFMFIFLIAITNFAFAENWMPKSKILSGSDQAFQLKKECERVSQEDCTDVGEYPASIYSESDVVVDDETKPIYLEAQKENCADQNECKIKLMSLVCLNDGYKPGVDLKNLFTFCYKQNGYEQKTAKKIIVDSAKLAIYSDNAIANDLKKTKKKGINEAYAKMECGRSVMALLLNRNSKKAALPLEEVLGVAKSDLFALLQAGNLAEAKDALNAFVPVNNVIKTADKNQMISELEDCLK